MSKSADFVISGNVLKKYKGNASHVTIPDGIDEIGKGAFADCKSLSVVNHSEGLVTIGDYAFMGCSELFSMSFCTTVTYIGDSAFEGCTGLYSVRMHSVTHIGARAFADCSSLGWITLYKGSWSSISKGYNWNAGTHRIFVDMLEGGYVYVYPPN